MNAPTYTAQLQAAASQGWNFDDEADQAEGQAGDAVSTERRLKIQRDNL